MSHPRYLPQAIFVLFLPLIVALWKLSALSAAGLVGCALLWRWGIVLSLVARPDRQPELVLKTISASHFVEKVRWCMDRLGLDYTEQPAGGTLGVFFTGRTVPQLWFRTGLVRSSLGNSPEILRYLWGRYVATHGAAAAFLEPTGERLALEERIDRCGADLQVWVYTHLLPDRALTLHAWGVSSPDVPWYQRILLRLLYPAQAFLIRKAFRLNPERFARSVARIETFLSEAEARLADGRGSLLGGDETNFTDLSFAAINGLWLQPADYGGRRADHVRIERSRAPRGMREDVERWLRDYPNVVAFVEELYEHR